MAPGQITREWRERKNPRGYSVRSYNKLLSRHNKLLLPKTRTTANKSKQVDSISLLPGAIANVQVRLSEAAVGVEGLTQVVALAVLEGEHQVDLGYNRIRHQVDLG